MTLSKGEMHLAATVGCLRQIENLAGCRRDAYGADPENGWTLHIEGAAGELAFAKWSKHYWSGNLGNLQADDVGRVQIRTRAKHGWELPIHPRDPDDRIFVLITGRAPQLRLRGWIWGRDGKDQQYWSDPSGKGRPAYFVPNAVLNPMNVSARATMAAA